MSKTKTKSPGLAEHQQRDSMRSEAVDNDAITSRAKLAPLKRGRKAKPSTELSTQKALHQSRVIPDPDPSEDMGRTTEKKKPNTVVSPLNDEPEDKKYVPDTQLPDSVPPPPVRVLHMYYNTAC